LIELQAKDEERRRKRFATQQFNRSCTAIGNGAADYFEAPSTASMKICLNGAVTLAASFSMVLLLPWQPYE